MSRLNYKKDVKVCATCRNWLGTRKPDVFRPPVFIEFDDSEHAECMKLRFNTNGTTSCPYWEAQYK